MAFNPATDLQALKNELSGDPVSIGYQGGGTDHTFDAADAVRLNDLATGRTVNQHSVDTGDIRGQTTFEAFDGLTTAEVDWFKWLTQNGVIPVTDDTLAQLAGIGGTSFWAVAERTLMESRMTALMQRAGSRAEELFGLGSTITASHVAQAVDLP